MTQMSASTTYRKHLRTYLMKYPRHAMTNKCRSSHCTNLRSCSGFSSRSQTILEMRLPNERFSCTFSTTLIVAGVVVGRLEERVRKSGWEGRTSCCGSHIRVFKDFGQWRERMSTPSNPGHGKEDRGRKNRLGR